MADPARDRARGSRWSSVRVRTTVGAAAVVAVALLVGAVLLVVLLRGSLSDGLEDAADERASALVVQIESDGPPRTLAEEEPDDEPEDTVVWISDSSGRLVVASQDLPPPVGEAERIELPDAEADYLVATEDATSPEGEEYVVRVAVSTEDVSDSVTALLPLLGVGLPLVLLVVSGTTWVVVGRALRPVERIRAEVSSITDHRLDRRVPVPRSRDEVHRLASTMNQMLERLEHSREQQHRFVSDASHELRSPLAGIRQTAEVAQLHPGALPEGELAQAVLEESERMQRIVEQMLVLTRADERRAVGAGEVDLDDVVLAEVTRVRRGSVRVEAGGVGPARLRGEAIALSQVVRNLLDNAARHARGTVRVDLAQVGDRLRLSVEDDGSGVPEADRMRVFDRFVRLDEARSRDAGGSGLGLAIVREIVRAHGGEVTCAASDLGGARFVVDLPRNAT